MASAITISSSDCDENLLIGKHRFFSLGNHWMRRLFIFETRFLTELVAYSARIRPDIIGAVRIGLGSSVASLTALISLTQFGSRQQRVKFHACTIFVPPAGEASQN